MRVRPIPALLLGIALLGGLIGWLMLPGTSVSDTHIAAHDPAEEHSAEPVASSLPVETNNKPPAQSAHQVISSGAAERYELSPAPDENWDASSVREQIYDSLHADEGLSGHNLMVLKDWSQRLSDSLTPAQLDVIWQEYDLLDPQLLAALQQLVGANRAEAELHEEWQGQQLQNVQAFEAELMEARRKQLSPELFAVLYRSEDSFIISEDGLQGYMPGPEAVVESGDSENATEALVEKWHAGELSESEFRHALLESLPHDAVEQLIETRLHEQAWLDKLGSFLEEYRYVEYAGLSGEDEMQMRKELIQRHFSTEDQAVVEQFLFGAQTTSGQSGYEGQGQL